MKNFLGALELSCIVRELRVVLNSKVKNIYHEDDELIFHLYSSELKKQVLRITRSGLVHLTEYLKENPLKPSNFCMFLRKHLKGASLVSVAQIDGERIIEFKFKRGIEEYYLIAELFGSGNFILCDKTHIIMQPLEFRTWSHRVIRPKQKYTLPPSRGFDQFNPDFSVFKKLLSFSGHEIVKALALDCGLGGVYAEELCLLTSINKNTNPSKLGEDDVKKLFDEWNSLLLRAKEANLSSRVIFEGDKPIDVIPFSLKIYNNYAFTEFPSFNKALDYFYLKLGKTTVTKKEEALTGEVHKYETVLKQQKEHVEKIKLESIDLRRKGEAIYSHLEKISSILSLIKELKRKGESWDEIQDRLKDSRDVIVSKLDTSTGMITLNAGSVMLEISIRSYPTKVANDYYSRAKKLTAKIPNALEAINKIEKKIEIMKSRGLERKPLIHKIERTKTEWFYAFKWMMSSEGFLIVCARDATQNEVLVRKYAEKDDLIFHADIHGSPFGIIKGGKKASQVTINEAAQFTASHSRAWKINVGTDVYYVDIEQVSKKAPSGEYIARGGFMIRGKKNYIKGLSPELCIGLKGGRVVSGTKTSIKTNADFYVTITPGEMKASLAAKKLQDYFKKKGYSISLMDIQHVLPSGSFNISLL